MDALGSLNLAELQKKWKNNPQLAVGASAVVGLFGLVYAVKRWSSSKDEETHIPDFALPNDDREMTARLNSIRNRRQARKHKKQKPNRNRQEHNNGNNQNKNNNGNNNENNNVNNNDINDNDNLQNSSNNSNSNQNGNDSNSSDDNEKSDEIYQDNYPNNGNNGNNGMMNDEFTNNNNNNNNINNNRNGNGNNNNNNDQYDGFHADEYYNPHLRIRKENLQRKSDGAFMTLFGLYASNTDENTSVSGLSNYGSNGNYYFNNQNNAQYMQQANYNEPPFPQNFQMANIAANDAPSTMSFESKEAHDVDQLSNHGSMVNNDMTMNTGTINAANIANHNNNTNINSNQMTSEYRFDNGINNNRMPMNTLDRLKDLYAKKQLPPSLQPDSLSMSLQSNPRQAAVSNRNNDSIMTTIKQMI